MAENVDLKMKAGIPYRRLVTLVDGKDDWGTLGACEVRCQVRAGIEEATTLRWDLTPHLTKSYVGNDIEIVLSLTGAETRLGKHGYYDMIISDSGVTDAKAIPLVFGQVEIEPTTTSAA